MIATTPNLVISPFGVVPWQSKAVFDNLRHCSKYPCQGELRRPEQRRKRLKMKIAKTTEAFADAEQQLIFL